MIHSERVPKSFCTTREAAQLLGVSLRTVQLWTESGLLEAWKTDGGHRRVSRESIERLVVAPSRGRVQSIAADATRESPPTVSSPAQPAPLRVLVVDDEVALRRLYAATMSRWPFAVQVEAAEDGYEALIRIGRNAPDLLIADLNMPGVDGFRMIRTIRMSPDLDAVAVVVVTGLDATEILARGGLPAGIPVLPKPIPFDNLRQIASRVAEARQAGLPAQSR